MDYNEHLHLHLRCKCRRKCLEWNELQFVIF